MIKTLAKQVRPVLLGKIKIGKWIKGQSGQKFDHFKIVRVGGTDRGDIIEDTETTNHIMSIMNLTKGQNITRIPIYFSGNTMEEVFDCWYSMRWGSKTLCRGDGITAQRANISVNGSSPQNGTLKINKGDKIDIDGFVTVPCAESDIGCPYYNPKPGSKSYCLMGAKMQVHIQGLTKRGGFFQFSTHSMHSTRNLYSGLAQFEKMLCGHLSFLPFELVIEPQRNQNNQLIYVVHLEMVGELQELRRKAIEAATVEMQFLKQMKYIREEGVKLLSMKSEDVSEDEGEKETEEFFANHEQIKIQQNASGEMKDDADEIVEDESATIERHIPDLNDLRPIP